MLHPALNRSCFLPCARPLARSQNRSQGQTEIVVVFDMRGYTLANSDIRTAVAVVKTLQVCAARAFAPLEQSMHASSAPYSLADPVISSHACPPTSPHGSPLTHPSRTHTPLWSTQVGYPERLFRCVMYMAPKIFFVLWRVVKPFMDDRIAAKVRISSAVLLQLWMMALSRRLLRGGSAGRVQCSPAPSARRGDGVFCVRQRCEPTFARFSPCSPFRPCRCSGALLARLTSLSKVQFAYSLEELHQGVDRAVLPPEYGGVGPAHSQEECYRHLVVEQKLFKPYPATQ